MSYGGYDNAPAVPSPSLDVSTPPQATDNNNNDRGMKRKRGEFDSDPLDQFHNPQFIQEQANFMISMLKSYRDENESLIYHPFLRLPDRDAFPDYFQIVKKPVSLAEVEERLSNEEYTSLQHVRDDLNQMFNNAKHYNQNGSDVYNAAQKLQKALKVHWKGLNRELQPETALLRAAFDELPSRRQTSNSVPPHQQQQQQHQHGQQGKAGLPAVPKRGRPSNAALEAAAAADPVKAWMQQTLKKLIDHSDDSGRAYSEFFIILPSKDFFPDYYQLIEHPIAFSQLQYKTKKGNYSQNFDAFVRDVNRVFSNAMTYNDESALVFQDAVELRRYFHELLQHAPVQTPSTMAAANQPKVKLRFGAGGGAAADAPTAGSASPAPGAGQNEKITLKFGGGGGGAGTPLLETAKAESPLPPGGALDGSGAPATGSAGTSRAGTPVIQPLHPSKPTRQHAQVSLPPKAGRSSSWAPNSSDLVSQYLNKTAQRAPSPPSSSFDSRPLPPPVAQRIPKTLAAFGSSQEPYLPIFHIRFVSENHVHSSSHILLNTFIRQHSITIPSFATALDIVVSHSVAPLPRAPKERGQPNWRIRPAADDPSYSHDASSDDHGAQQGARQSKLRQLHASSSKPKYSIRARPTGARIREEPVAPASDGPYALTKFSCKLSSQEMSTYEIVAVTGDVGSAVTTSEQLYRLFVIRNPE